MKTLLLSVCLFVSLSAAAQSESFLTFKSNLAHAEDVVCLHVGGWFLHTALQLSGEDVEEIGDIRSVRFINVPQRELKSRGLKLSGFKKILAEDGFEHLISVTEHGDDIAVYVQKGKRENLYFMLVEEPDEVTAFEIRGNLDPSLLIKKCAHGENQL